MKVVFEEAMREAEQGLERVQQEYRDLQDALLVKEQERYVVTAQWAVPHYNGISEYADPSYPRCKYADGVLPLVHKYTTREQVEQGAKEWQERLLTERELVASCLEYLKGDNKNV